ncbi:sulfotransferase family 2 domain-containing protein [Paracoccus sp. IB05]|uniref:sulfotransferase family 2 domain-containing protein n=1 Tax=Paracoccus sp. IB05 TaxID=2779367 RepID=UPI0018E7B740|nr:sulfotransferase family 2 domain-containing protein [Paracoccus sp. IB05]MBJ2152573.1 sulfotransferase domain-containing protein [Paracoccus sp. IB05]
MKTCYVFPHVPKCGGTSLLTQLRTSGIKMHEDYEAYNGPQFIDANADLRNFGVNDLIFGHFPIDRYIGPEFRYIALVRDPLDRVISNYHFHMQWGLERPDDTGFFAEFGREIAKGNVTIIQYIMKAPNMRMVYKNFLRYWGKHRFTLIGRTDRYEDFATKLNDLLGTAISASVQERKSGRKLDLPDRVVEQAHRLLGEEYHWFNKFVEIPA